MIYGEESMTLDFGNGLFFSETRESIPDGFCSEFRDVLVDWEGNLIPRGSFLSVNVDLDDTTVLDIVGALSTTQTPRYIYNGLDATPDRVQFVDLGGFGTDTPTGIVGYKAIGGTVGGQFTILNYEISAPGVFSRSDMTGAVNVNPRWNTACMYRDRIYYWYVNGANYEIRRLSGWNFAAGFGAYVHNAVASTPAVATATSKQLGKILYYNGRLFSWIDNRVYFTDAIAVGGYPEAWVPGTNFFDLPSDGKPTIYNIMVVNNIMYIWSEDGLYTLQTYGLPAQWTVRKINTQARTHSHVSSCLDTKNVMYFFDGQDIFMTDGESELINIGIPIKYLWARSTDAMCVGLFPFKDGILASIQQQGVVMASDGNFRRFVQQTTNCYFDGQRWVQFGIKTNFQVPFDYTIANPCIISSTVVAKAKAALSATVTGKTTYLNFATGSVANMRLSVLQYLDRDWQETMDCSVVIPVKQDPFKMERLKSGHVGLFGSSQWTVDRKFFKKDILPGINPAEEEYTIPAFNSSGYLPDGYSKIQFKLPQMTHTYGLRFRIRLTWDWFIWVSPPFRMTDIKLVYNTGRNLPGGPTT